MRNVTEASVQGVCEESERSCEWKFGGGCVQTICVRVCMLVSASVCMCACEQSFCGSV